MSRNAKIALRSVLGKRFTPTSALLARKCRSLRELIRVSRRFTWNSHHIPSDVRSRHWPNICDETQNQASQRHSPTGSFKSISRRNQVDEVWEDRNRQDVCPRSSWTAIDQMSRTDNLSARERRLTALLRTTWKTHYIKRNETHTQSKQWRSLSTLSARAPFCLLLTLISDTGRSR